MKQVQNQLDCLKHIMHAIDRLEDKQPYRCCFCKKDESEVWKLVGSAPHFHCDECITRSYNLLQEMKHDERLKQ